MGKYMIKRILIAIPVLIGITIIDYAIMCLAGSPLQMLQGPRISQAAVAAKEIALGLDKPLSLIHISIPFYLHICRTRLRSVQISSFTARASSCADITTRSPVLSALQRKSSQQKSA